MNKTTEPISERLLLLLGSGLLLVTLPYLAGLVIIFGIWTIHFARDHRFFANYVRGLNMIMVFVQAEIAHQLLVKFRPGISEINPLINTYAAIIAGIPYLLFWQFFLSKLKEMKARLSYFLIIPPTMILFLVPFFLGPNENVKLLLEIFVCLSLRDLWSFAYFLINSEKGSRVSVLDAIMPFWNHSAFPMQVEPGLRSSRVDTILSGVRLLIYVFFGQCLIYLVRSLSITNLVAKAIVTYQAISFMAVAGNEPVYYFFQSDIYSGRERWLICIGGFLFHVLELIVRSGVTVAGARLCGIPMFRNVYRPFDSRSFYEVLTRTNYFYVQAITKVGMNPLISYFKFLPMRLRISLSVFLSIFVFGTVFHFFRFPVVTYSHTLPLDFAIYVGYLPYFFSIAVAAAISVWCTLTFGTPIESRWRHWARNGMYLVIYAIIFSLIGGDYYVVPGTQHIEFVLRLLGIKN